LPTSERVLPGDRLVLVGLGVVAQRLGEPPDCFEIVVAPAGQLADGVEGEELVVGLRRRELPRHVLDAVLADVEVETVGVVRPRATRTVETAVFMVHYEERADPFRRFPRPLEYASNTARRTPPGRRMIVLMPGITTGRYRATADRRLARYRAEHQLFCVIYVLR